MHFLCGIHVLYSHTITNYGQYCFISLYHWTSLVSLPSWFLNMLILLIRYSKFQSVGNITLHFPDNFGGDTSKIHYIGFKGEATQVL